MRWATGARFAVAACLLALLGSGCTPTPSPPASPTPTPSATPTETAQEREERLAYEAAEKSYREFRAEVERVFANGGAKQPTATMKATATGSYLASYQRVSEAYFGLKHHSEGQLVISDVTYSGYSSTEVLIDTCEDGTAVTTFDSKGKRLYSDDIRELHLVVRLIDSRWKVASGTGKEVSACDH